MTDLKRIDAWVAKAFSILAVSDYSLEIRSPVFLASKKATSLRIICSNTSYLRDRPILSVMSWKMNLCKPERTAPAPFIINHWMTSVLTLSKSFTVIASMTNPMYAGVTNSPTIPQILRRNPKYMRHLYCFRYPNSISLAFALAFSSFSFLILFSSSVSSSFFSPSFPSSLPLVGV